MDSRGVRRVRRALRISADHPACDTHRGRDSLCVPLLGIAYIFCWLLIPEEAEEFELSYYDESAGGGSEPDPMGPQQAIGPESEEDIPADPWANDDERVSS